MRLALFQPDIPQNVGAAMRLAACLGVTLDLVGPLGFALDDRGLRRAALDYGPLGEIVVHADWAAFLEASRAAGRRLALLTTRGDGSLYDFAFAPGDTILLGRESAGAPAEVHAAAAARLRIPLVAPARSLNLVVAAALALGEALRQTDGFPKPCDTPHP